MTLSRKLQSKILKTKKKLSSDDWYSALFPIAIMTVFAMVFVGSKTVSQSPEIAFVRAEIPVLSVPPVDNKLHRYQHKMQKTIGAQTPTVVLDDTGDLYFGDLAAFTTEYQNIRNKFVIRASDGSPQVDSLLENLDDWADARTRPKDKGKLRVIVLLPASTVPMNVLTKVMSKISFHPTVDRVVLGSGML